MPALKATDMTRMLVHRRSADTRFYPLDSPTSVLGANSSAAASFSWGFDFRLDGTAYTSAYLSGRGFVDFTNAAPGADPAVFFGSTNLPLIAAWWDDCATADTVGYVKAEVQGTAPFRRCVIEWYIKLLSTQTGTDYERGKVQAVLFETWDRVELRYGALEVGGSPSRTGYGAVAGICADMAGGNRRRSFLSDTLVLGGRDSATPAYAVAPTDWPAVAFVAEPNYPFTGRFLGIGADELSGLQTAYSDPVRKLANDVNWHFLCHAPPLVNVAPYYDGGATVGANDQSIVQPIVPSADGLEYDVRIVTYGTATLATLAVAQNDVAEPDPDTAGDWTDIDTTAEATISGLTEWSPLSLTIPAATTALRFRVTCSGTDKVRIMAIMVTPRVTDLIDLAAGAGSGFEFMGLGQIIQEGASIHPEWYNRAWRNPARVMADRRQRLFSMAIPFVHGGTPKVALTLDSTAAQTARTIGLSPASFVGQGGATVRISAYAYDTGSDGTNSHVYVSERGGGGGASLTIPNNGSGAGADTYGLVETTLEVTRGEPAFAVTMEPVTELHLLALSIDWVPGE